MIKCRWYVLHAYSGYEKKVADSIVDQANKLGIADHIEEVSVPTQNIVEVKRGVRVNTERKIFPGYILIKMNLNDDTWHIIKNTPKLSGFLGNKGKPVPIVMLRLKEYPNKSLMVLKNQDQQLCMMWVNKLKLLMGRLHLLMEK